MASPTTENSHHVVIVGGGFGGLYTAQALHNAPVMVTLIDKHNYHLFQPLLYQVATGGLSPGDIASPMRAILKNQANASVMLAEVVDIDPQAQVVMLKDGELKYDTLVLATGVANHYFGHQDWESRAPGLKTIDDALEIRRRILLAFEAAEREPDPVKRKAWMTFVVIGGGPTGVELAGAIAELAHGSLKGEFNNIDPAEAEIILLEGQEAVLPPYPAAASEKARQALEKLGVMIQIHAMVEIIGPDSLIYHQPDGCQAQIQTHTILWAAGMQATPLTEVLQKRTGAELDRSGRVMVDGQLGLPGFPNIFAIGDMAHFVGADGIPLPGVAPVAMQQGKYVANLIRSRCSGLELPGFTYQDYGSLAVIGRNAAVAVFGKLQISGVLAWLAWIFIHLYYLIEFDNKILVLLQWAWNYFTRKRGARLITGREPIPLLAKDEGDIFPSNSNQYDAQPIKQSSELEELSI
jgi:NADH dehydrogenase